MALVIRPPLAAVGPAYAAVALAAVSPDAAPAAGPTVGVPKALALEWAATAAVAIPLAKGFAGMMAAGLAAAPHPEPVPRQQEYWEHS